MRHKHKPVWISSIVSRTVTARWMVPVTHSEMWAVPRDGESPAYGCRKSRCPDIRIERRAELASNRDDRAIE
jgi:hypothetical protein